MCNNNLEAVFELLSESEYEYEMLFESSDEEDILSAAVNMCGRNPRACIKNYLSEVVPSYSDEELKKHFRINRSLYEKLCNMFECSDDYQKLRADKRCAGNKHIALFLWFAGHEACSVRDLADRFNLSQSTVSVLLNRAITFISSLSPCVFQWPNEEEKKRSSDFFQNKSGFPKVIGAIDCTHITIDPPSSAKDDYFDRKGNISIILQAICNEKKKFLDIFVGFPGSSHDSWVFQNSFIYPKLRRACGDYLILGDSAYQCMVH